MQNRTISPRLGPPLAGGAAAVAATLLLRSELDIKLFAEIVVDASTYGLQPAGFSFFLELFGGFGKPLLFLSVMLGQVTIFAIAWRYGRKYASGLQDGAVFAALLSFVVISALSMFMILVTAAELGSRTSWFSYLVATLLASMIFAMVAAVSEAFPANVASYGSRSVAGARRAFLAQVPGFVVGALSLVVMARFFLDATGGGARGYVRGQPTPEVTSNEDFYLVSKNLIDPQVDGSRWRLRVGGSTRNSLEMTLADVEAFGSKEQYTTLQCISNPVGGELMSNALWTGFPLRDLLAQAGPLPSAAYVVFKAEDDYTESLPLEFAMNESVILAYRMNGEPLPSKHGYPVRLIAPGKYGIKNTKWITEIALMNEETFGYWQRRYWTQEARMNTSTRIDVPGPGSEANDSPYRIHGVAFSGNRGISRVEVSTDDGRSWNDAVIKPALSPYTWVLWHYDWVVAGQNERAAILARATDGDGDLQTAVEAPPHPSGATGYPRVSITVDTGIL